MAVSLKKGGKVSLKKKDGTSLTQVCLGVNWGAIKHTKKVEKKVGGIFGFGGTVESVEEVVHVEDVDLDASLGMFDANGILIDKVYFPVHHQRSNCGSVQHSGDDLTGDQGEADDDDNETIAINLTTIPARITKLALVLNSFKSQDFGDIPYAGVRIYQGTMDNPGEVLATYDIANDETFKGHVSMVLGILERTDDGWKFNAIGDPVKAVRLDATLRVVQEKYLNA